MTCIGDKMEKVRLTFLNIAHIEENLPAIISCLTPQEIRKAERLIRKEDKLLSYGGAFLARRYLGKNAEIMRTKAGKPYASGGYFSISHSVDTVGISFCERREVGLDIEKVRSGYDDLAARFCSEEELISGYDFLSLFTAKESLTKAEGEGLSGNLRAIPALPVNGPVYYKGKDYFRHTVEINGYRVSVSVEGSDFISEEEIIDEF